ncbi:MULTISPECIES: HemK2/MTQ2 family protein methyltransferase [Nocardia]|uniref:Release factor glutamine methyltransferase n=1 Tax=Nocardia farcinica TaxID=37329 RepID=A0A0H5P4M4_NOCFR|nr:MULTISPECIES: HemK2/MTQ2 family protein methyltransferase [Nocardia]AXK87832.1 methyltransferase domain-containing protein [Nocardia farcinica]MBF6069313.1 methyltransferase [Nocardia farcinica]MBF6142912.1 methyltransferase [Nocardia farcinica]MBF6188842.1 methyltransferase [Nocardia farcinica]MBF6270728.1 methyltransferase [Nocardia farcinica]
MRLLRAPGVYRPQTDTRLLAEAATAATLPQRPRVLDSCTGTGALAIAAAEAGAESVTAVDLSRRAVATAWLNSRLRGLPIELLRGDFAAVLGERTFDVVLANPPYVPCADPHPARGADRAWDAGHDGRAVLDRLCDHLPRLLAPRGVALIVHSELCGEETSLRRLRDNGLKASTVARHIIPFGPVLRERAAWLESVGLIAPGQRHEELVVIRADRIER